MDKLFRALLFLLLCAGVSSAVTYTVSYKNLAQTFTAVHTWQPSAPGTPFYIGANASEIQVADLHAEVMTRLAANPSNCTSGQILQGIDGSGGAEGCANVEIDVGGGLLRYPGKANSCLMVDDGSGAPTNVWGTCTATSAGTVTNNAVTDTEQASTNYAITTNLSLYGLVSSTEHVRSGQLIVFEVVAGMQELPGVARHVYMGIVDNPGAESALYASDDPAGDMAFFRWNSAVESEWACGTGDGTTTASASTGITVDANLHTFKIELDAAKSYAKFYIDGTLVCNRTTNVPGSDANTNMSFRFRGRNEAGGGNTGLRIVSFYFSHGTES